MVAGRGPSNSTLSCEHQELVVGRGWQTVVAAAHVDVGEACPLEQQHQLVSEVHPHRQLMRLDRDLFLALQPACADLHGGALVERVDGEHAAAKLEGAAVDGASLSSSTTPPGSSVSGKHRSACPSWARLLRRPMTAHATMVRYRRGGSS